jgi:hypothetical protein
MRARMAGNEASAIGSLRAINSSQATFASSCAAGNYAQSLEDLATAPAAGGGEAFISQDLSATGVAKSGYHVTVTGGTLPAPSVVSAVAACNTKLPGSTFYSKAEPITPGSTGQRAFASNQSGTIWQDATGVAPTEAVMQPSGGGVVIQ